MPYEIEWSHHGVVKHFMGEVTFEDVISSEKAIVGNSNFMSLKYVLSTYLLAKRVTMDHTQRRDLRALRLGGYYSNPRIKYAFVTKDMAIKGPIEQSVADGETLHPVRVFERYEHAAEWLGI
jgi:hypothetical protein